MKRILKLIWLPALVLAIALAAALSLSGLLPYKVYAVRTGSMAPRLPPKTAVLVFAGHYKIGQVVTYKKGNEFITHRLKAISPSGNITTKGDANASADPWHEPSSAIIGGVVAAVPGLGYWMIYLKNPFGLASIVDLVVIIWLIWDLATIRTPNVVPASEPAPPPPSRPVRVIDGLSPSPRLPALA